MLRAILVSLVIVVFVGGVLPAQAQGENPDCPGALPRRLLIGGMARATQNVGVNFRAEPHTGALLLGTIPSGGEMEVIGGPVCADGIEWWEVDYIDGSGWIAEGVGNYWLEPVLEAGTVLLPNAGGPISYGGVTMQFDPALAHTLAAFHAPFHAPDPNNPDDLTVTSELEHLTFTLLGYPDRVLTRWVTPDPAITVTSTADFDLVAPNFMDSQPAPDVLRDLQALLADRPDLSTFEQLPFLGRGHIAEVFIAQAEYLETDTLQGVRYLTSLSQGVRFVANDVIFYHFDGITRDGAVYVSASFPVNASTLDDTLPDLGTMAAHDEYMAAHPTYHADIVAALNTQAEFSPPLETLDALIGSIEVGAPPASGAFSLDNITIPVDPALATGITGEDHVPEDQWDVARYEFVLAGYPGGEANLYVYRTETFAANETMFGDAARWLMENLPPVLEARPDPAAFDTFENTLPDLSPGAAQGLLAQVRYLDFQGGQGYRFVTYYTQAIWGPGNDILQYVYLGLSDDGQYLVNAQFDIDASILPAQGGPPAELDDLASDDDAYFAAYRQYVTDISADLDALPDTDFTPPLDRLDALIAGITIAPAGE